MKAVAKGFALLAGISLLLACERAYAITVTGVEVDIGSAVFTNWNGAGVNQLGASGTTITAGQDLILTQNSTTPGNFNFDTSDVLCAGSVSACPAPVIKVTIQGVGTVPFIDGTPANNVLHDNNSDPRDSAHNESKAWTLLGSIAGIKLWVGYADDAHTNACADAGEGPGTAGNCHPDPWQGSFNTIFLGNLVTESTPDGCARPFSVQCFDAGALRMQFDSTSQILAVTEPSSVLLLGFGLIALAVCGSKLKKL
jgi:PEP-CTERM motif